MATAPSPLAPERFPEMPPIDGVRLATRACGVRYPDRDDVLLVELAESSAAAGVLTRSVTASAPVEWCRKALDGGRARALLVNSGNANAFTGFDGARAVERCVDAVAEAVGCRRGHVFVASTGVIGEPLPHARITAELEALRQGLRGDAWEAAARAIMTTDTYPKGATRTARIGDVPVTINGIAKGSGMIAPNMATMLAFVFTDAAISPDPLQVMLMEAIEPSFNCITVDGDTSTSDTVLLTATGRAGNLPADLGSGALEEFRVQLASLCLELAHQVVRDGEGASKFVTVTVTGAESDRAAKHIAMTIANSPLVKTAIAGADANWGRIVMAVGKAGEKADRSRIAITMGGHAVAEMGSAVPGYDEGPVAAHMRGNEIEIAVDVGVGAGTATVWTCDLTHGYIDINADYRT